MMSNIEILEEALKLRPDERIAVVDGLLRSLDVPDADLDRVWAEEALRRLTAYRKGEVKATPIDDLDLSRETLLAKIRKDRETMRKKGVWLTDEIIESAKNNRR